MLPRYPGWFSATFSEQIFGSVRPPRGQKRRFSGALARFGPGGRVENIETQFPGAGGPETEKKTTLSGMIVRNLLTVYVLTERTPTSEKSQTMGVLGHFRLGRASALKEVPGPGRNRKKNTISRR